MNGRHIIVTGGSRGLGAALVEGLLDQGYRISTCSRTPSELIERLQADSPYKHRFYWQACTIGEAGEVERFVRDAFDWAGDDGLFGLINNAGAAQAGVLATFPDVETEKIIRINLLGAIQAARAASGLMLRTNTAGRIINVSSIIGSRGYSGLAAYSASKAGLDGLTRALARELGSRGITVNSIAPGYIRTEMSSTLDDAELDQITRRTPLGRLATSADVVGLASFLLSNEAAFITGQTIFVDGGVSC